MASIALRLGVAATLLLGACSNVATLRVGECFDPPTTVGETVADIIRQACTDPHGAEVVFVGELPSTDSSYPGDADLFSYFEANCEPAFNAYTGLDFATAAEYDMSAFTPTEDSWADGDRTVICYALRIDEVKMTQSIRKT